MPRGWCWPLARWSEETRLGWSLSVLYDLSSSCWLDHVLPYGNYRATFQKSENWSFRPVWNSHIIFTTVDWLEWIPRPAQTQGGGADTSPLNGRSTQITLERSMHTGRREVVAVSLANTVSHVPTYRWPGQSRGLWEPAEVKMAKYHTSSFLNKQQQDTFVFHKESKQSKSTNAMSYCMPSVIWKVISSTGAFNRDLNCK